jgi:hypothetical protein
VRTISWIASALIATSGVAWAESEDEPVDGGPAAEEPPERHVLPAKRGVVQAFLDINLSKELEGDPISLAPDIWYGVSDVLTVGLVHSNRAMVGYLGIPGDGICFTGEEGGCAKVYDQVGVDVRYHLKDMGAITIAADGGLFAMSFDPFQLAVKLGAVARWTSGKLAADLAPSVLVGLTEREPEGGGMVVVENNTEDFFLPATVYYEVIPKLSVAGQVAVWLPSQETADTWLLGASIGGQYMVSEAIFADLVFSLPALAGGPEDGTGADFRSLSVGGGYAF